MPHRRRPITFFVMYCDGCVLVKGSFEISQLLNGNGEAWLGALV